MLLPKEKKWLEKQFAQVNAALKEITEQNEQILIKLENLEASGAGRLIPELAAQVRRVGILSRAIDVKVPDRPATPGK